MISRWCFALYQLIASAGFEWSILPLSSTAQK